MKALKSKLFPTSSTKVSNGIVDEVNSGSISLGDGGVNSFSSISETKADENKYGIL
jgi:hypothetical protein